MYLIRQLDTEDCHGRLRPAAGSPFAAGPPTNSLFRLLNSLFRHNKLQIPPWHGTAGNALLTDQNGFNNSPPAQLWVGFNSAAEFQKLRVLAATQQYVFVEGLVIADPTQLLGFFLDPKSTLAPEGLIPELVQPMRTVSDNLNVWNGQNVAFMVKVEQTN